MIVYKMTANRLTVLLLVYLRPHLVELVEEEFCEGALVCHEPLVAAHLRDLALPHNHDLVHLGQEPDGVRHQDPGLLLQEA